MADRSANEYDDPQEINDLLSATAYDNQDHRLGTINGVFAADESGAPTFAEVNYGVLGLSTSLVPLRGSTIEEGKLILGFAKDAIQDAPNVDMTKGLTFEDQENIYVHYGLKDTADPRYPEPPTTEAADEPVEEFDRKPARKAAEESSAVDTPEPEPDTRIPHRATADASPGARASDADTTVGALPEDTDPATPATP